MWAEQQAAIRRARSLRAGLSLRQLLPHWRQTGFGERPVERGLAGQRRQSADFPTFPLAPRREVRPLPPYNEGIRLPQPEEIGAS